MTVLREVAGMVTTTESKRIRFAFGGIFVLFALFITIVAAVAPLYMVGPTGLITFSLILAFLSGFWGFYLMSLPFVEE
jgi:drug/metabolite transporter superfamily protein YnfA